MKHARRHYLVNARVQFQYMSLVAIPLVVLLAALYYLIYYSMLYQILIPEGITAILLPAMRKVNLIVSCTIPVVLFLIVRTALVYSNRIVGPIPRIERELDKVIAGDYTIRVHARDNDELRGFIEKVNALIEKADRSAVAASDH